MKSLRRTPVALFLLLALAAPACGESHTTTGTDAGITIMFDAPGTPGVDSGGTTTTDSGTTTDPDTGGITPDPDSGGIPTTDGGGVTLVDSGMTMRPDSGPPGVECGTVTCTDPQICCVTGVGGPGGGGMPMFDCTLAADCTGIPASCDGPEDCAAGEACCASGGPGGGGMASCAAAGCFISLCHTEADCPAGDMCCPFMMGGAMISVCSGFGCF